MPPRTTGRTSLTPGTRSGEDAARLLDVQCWLWGQDIRSPAGDLLVRAGMERASWPDARGHGRYYLARLPDGGHAMAWSGGLLFGDEERSLLFPRTSFAPVVLPASGPTERPPNLSRVDARQLPPADHDADASRIRAALGWLAAYEDTVAALAGAGWRAGCASRYAEAEQAARDLATEVGVEYEPLPAPPADGLAASWRTLARLVER